ncbi:MAG: arylesterase [Halioglobus sp.]|nr:arylesterase [Halioglobus sp.]|tara:strand:+ start:1710 stop:2342 length:633 start_codon:yes stop_codon:yes gene_type:complete
MQSGPYHLLRTFLAAGWLLLAAGAAHASGQTILVVGDSISAAYGMSLQQGWVSLLQEELGEQHTVVNASISGETSAGGLRRLPPLLARHDPDLVIIELGANDGLRGFPLPTLRDNLARMAQLSQDSGARVLLVPMEIPPNYGARYTSGFRATYATVAQATGSALSPFIMEQFATDPTFMQEDGIHPTAPAQAMMLDTLLPAIQQLLAQSS